MAHVLHGGRALDRSGAAGAARKAARFGLHLFEMCMAMCVGVAVLDVPYVAIARAAGYADPITDLPELTATVVAFNMSLPMALWMRVRGHDGRCIRDMCAAMGLEAVVLIAGAGVGVVPRAALVAWQHTLMLPVMVVAMLPRLDMYTAKGGHQPLVPRQA